MIIDENSTAVQQKEKDGKQERKYEKIRRLVKKVYYLNKRNLRKKREIGRNNQQPHSRKSPKTKRHFQTERAYQVFSTLNEKKSK